VTTGSGGQGISVVRVEALAPFRPPGQLVCADPDDQELCAGIWPVATLARSVEARSMTTGATPPRPPLRGAADVARWPRRQHPTRFLPSTHGHL
jgi:hypothetical protein